MNNNIFEINKECEIYKENVEGSDLYFINNFYLNPDQIVEFFLNTDSNLHKIDEPLSKNSIYFEDRRHTIVFPDINKIYKFVGNICKQSPLYEDTIITNLIRFKKCDFNDYKNNYWWPHYDYGYTAIVYLNKNNSSSGTNLYKNLDPTKEPPKIAEHCSPWRSKSKYQLIKTIESNYNQMVLFDGLKFFHGMNICNDDYFSKTYRLNQVFFFKREYFVYS